MVPITGKSSYELIRVSSQVQITQGRNLWNSQFLLKPDQELTLTENTFSDKVCMQVMGLMEIPDPTGAEHPHSAMYIFWQPSERQTADSTHPAALALSHSGLFDNNCGELTRNKEINTAANTPKDKTAKGN